MTDHLVGDPDVEERLEAEPAHPADAGLPVVGNRVHFPGLDGLRAMAALAVLVHHVSSATGTNTSHWTGAFFARMDAGVPVFFLLSGFLLYRPFVVAHLEDRPGPALGAFYWRRLLRIVPAYWLALTFAIVVLGTVDVGDAGDVLWLYGFAQIYSKAHVLDGLVQAWSLAVEVSFYLFLPLFAVALRSIPAVHRVRTQLLACAGLWVIGFGTHAALLATHDEATPATLWLPSQLDLFALGMGLAVVSAWAARRRTEPGWILWVGRHPGLWWSLAGVSFLVVSTGLDLPREFVDLTARQELGRQLLYAATAFFLLLPAVFGDPERGRIRAFLRVPLVAWLGLVSYGVYLWHKDLLDRLLEEGAAGWLPDVRFLSLLALVVALTLAAAALSYYLLERPVLRLKGRVPWRRRPAPARADELGSRAR